MSIMSSAPLAGQDRPADESRCPKWCVIHSPSDEGFVHYSDIAEVRQAGSRPVEVSVNCLQPDAGGPLDEPFVLLCGPTESELTPDEALHLAGLLILAARRAVSK